MAMRVLGCCSVGVGLLVGIATAQQHLPLNPLACLGCCSCQLHVIVSCMRGAITKNWLLICVLLLPLLAGWSFFAADGVARRCLQLMCAV
jgi:hypothetical protein